jgi:hypothetical protein
MARVERVGKIGAKSFPKSLNLRCATISVSPAIQIGIGFSIAESVNQTQWLKFCDLLRTYFRTRKSDVKSGARNNAL